MIKLDYRNVDAMLIGEENGLDIDSAFNEYKDKIAHIIADLNKRKDKEN